MVVSVKNSALNRRSPSPKTPSIFPSSYYCIALNNSLNLFFFQSREANDESFELLNAQTLRF